MARSKRGGNSGASPRSRGTLGGSFVSSSSSRPQGQGSASSKSRYFSLADEAQNTERHHSRWSSDQKLRNSKVNFVSAAFSQPINSHEETAEERTTSDLSKRTDGPVEQSQHAMAQMVLRGSRESMLPDTIHDTDYYNRLLHETEAVQQDRARCAKEDTEASRPPSFVIDTVGSGFKQTGLTLPVIRSISPTPSNSSEEVVLFHGRNKTKSKTDEVFEFQTHAAAPVQELLGSSFVGDSLLKALENSTKDGFTSADLPLRKTQPPHQPLNRNLAAVSNEHSAQFSPAEGFTATGWAARPPVWAEKPTAWAHRSERAAQASKARPTHNNSEAGNRRSKNARKRQNRQLTRDKDILEDYVANLRANGEFEDIHQQSTHRQRDLKLPDADEWDSTDEAASGEEKVVQASAAGPGEWGSTELDDLQELSTSEEAFGAVRVIIRKRERRPGRVQYLVVHEGDSFDDAKWRPMSALITEEDMELIRQFEAEVAQFNAQSDAESEADTDDDEEEQEQEEEEEEEEEDSDQADLESSLDGEERERWLDEEDLRQRRKDRMDDETIARLLAKQEELGMGSDELLLYDDDGDEMNLDNGLLPSSSNRFNTILRPSRQHGRGSKRARGEYPAAGLFADVLDQDPYNGFDIMDFDRPSLKKKTKARREILPFELSDEELASNLQTAWLADRDKKKLKKAERQELRAQGLLGKKNQHKADLSMKYVEGMSIVQIKAEFKAFLDSPHQSRPFPPMDKRDRKIIHEIASVFKLKSKSAGAGKNRFPVVIKTRLTQEYQEDTFDALYAKLSRRFFPRMDKKGGLNRDGARGKGKAAIPRRGFGAAQAGYRDGEIVGATAPEIGIDNRGRAMLEKMGWNTGMALGALGNDRGILQPIAHVVKTSKAGLG